MRGRPAAVALLLAAALLAGCTGGGAKAGAGKGPGNDLPVEVSATTGAIRCVVVDDQIRPVGNATVVARGSTMQRNTTTDDQGRCVLSGLDPGTYFLVVTSPRTKPVQSSVEVAAGVTEPPLTRIQVERLFTQAAYSVQVVRDGFFQCSQDGASVFYSSSNCSDGIFGPASEAEPALSNVTTQQREWHSDVAPGWQEIVFEMAWEPTSDGTSQKMGMIVSTYKPTRDGAHCFAELIGTSPDRLQIDVGVAHETNCGVKPTQIPPEGMQNMSYFVSVRSADGLTPGLAVNQEFKVYLTMFHYGRPKEGWSVVAGDPLPF
jgi:hypothetical protein